MAILGETKVQWNWKADVKNEKTAIRARSQIHSSFIAAFGRCGGRGEGPILLRVESEWKKKNSKVKKSSESILVEHNFNKT